MSARSAARIAATALAGATAASALGGCSLSVGALQHRTSSYSVTAAVRTLVVNTQVGGVKVTGGGASAVSVTEHVTYNRTAPAVMHRITAGTLELSSKCPSLETCSVSYDIIVPRQLTVRIHDDAGTIRLASLSGPVTAHTSAGDIDLRSMSGPIVIGSDAGSILGSDLSSAHATLRLSAGDIDATFSAPPATIAATAAVGSVTLRLPRDVPYAVNATATVGTTQVSVTRNMTSPHVITAATSTGSITIEPAP